MKRIVASLGLVALGAACVQSANAQGDPSKPWTVSAALRGFYDDNIDTSPSGGQDSFGFEITPTIAFQLPAEQTTASLVYTYCYRWYDHRPAGNTGNDDQTHTIAATVSHNFSERTSVMAADSFVIGQEPDVLAVGYAGFDSSQRISGNNIRNYGTVTVNHQITREWGVEVGYVNSFFDYEDQKSDHPGNTNYVSQSGVLDRIEHAIHTDLRWLCDPNTTYLVGYQFGLGSYIGDEVIGHLADGSAVMSDDKDYYSHTMYVGVEHTFRPDFTGSLRGGVTYFDNYASPTEESSWTPYAKANLRYIYAKDSFFEVGGSYDRSATDVNSIDEATGSITTSGETGIIYASVTQRLLPSLYGTLMGTFQNTTFDGGSFDGRTEQYYLFSASLEYRINRHISATASYHFDHVDSHVPLNNTDFQTRSYDRNRVFLGAVFTY